MKKNNIKRALFALLTLASSTSMMASFVIDGKTYEVDTISQREIGPGIVHTRMRIPDYPLNINTIKMDMNNTYNRLELTQAEDQLGKTERLADAYTRHSLEGKNPIAGANGSFWCVPQEKPASEYVLGHPYGGCVYNGKIVEETNMYRDRWEGGPENSGMVGVDTDKKLWINQLSWKGYAKCSKWANTPEIFQVNRRCYENELVMYNSFYGKDRAFNTSDANTNVYFRLKAGEKWAVNKDIKATVQEIIQNKGAQKLGEYDFCLSATGDYKVLLEQLAIGDEVTISYAWTTLDKKITPNIENIIEGQSLVVRDGEKTWLNDKGYCSMVYSRTAYGSSADQKTLYLIVIDKSTNEYGYSEGCPTSVMSQIMLQSGCSNLCSMDAGGSAQMMIGGKVVNKTTEGTPRGTANGMMLYSTAPRSNEVSRIAFDQYDITMPVLSSYTPKMLGYNQYGDLIDEDVKGFTLTCDPVIGTTNGSTLTAGAKAGYGALTATYKGYSVVRPVTTKVTGAMSFRIKPTIILDGTRKYPLEVNTTIGRNTYYYNPSHLDWTIGDASVVKIENGVMSALKEGVSTIKCALNELGDETNVKVEIADKPILPQAWTGWTLKASGAKELVLTEGGVLNMNYTGGRGQNIKMTKDVSFYSLPDKIMLDFTSSIPLEYVQIDFRSATMAAANYIAFGKELEGGYLAGKRYQIELKISELGDPKDMQLYPISLKGITFYPPSVGVTKGANAITIHGLTSEYTNYSGVESITGEAGTSIKVYPNPVVDGTLNISTVADKADVNIYALSGTLVHKATVIVNGGSTSIDVTALSPGIYFVKVDTATDNKIQKIIIR
ncbi:MAG: phosphodiester glycosidase family protein [Muribaculaceae bacterium]